MTWEAKKSVFTLKNLKYPEQVVKWEQFWVLATIFSQTPLHHLICVVSLSYNAVSSSGVLSQEGHQSVGASPEEATKMIRRIEQLSSEDYENQVYSALKEDWGDRIAALQYLKAACRKDGERLFTRACDVREGSSGFKLKEGSFRLDTWKKSFTMRVLRHALALIAQRSCRCLIPGNV